MSTTTAVTTPSIPATQPQPSTSTGAKEMKFSISSILNIDSDEVTLATENFIYNMEKFWDVSRSGEDIFDINEVYEEIMADNDPSAPDAVVKEIKKFADMCKTHHCAFLRIVYP